jgi:formylglycine-generating enzyme required for sulfatase activity
MIAKKITFLLCILCAVFAASLEPGLKPKMIAVTGGTFFMGTNEGVYSANAKVHEVSLKSFVISETPVTQELYTAVMKNNPSRFKGGDRPVDSVSWFDAITFCNALSEQSGLPPAYTIDESGVNVTWDRDSRGFRLPTEAEWEYAARGGQKGALGEPLTTPRFAGSQDINELAWYNRNSNRQSQPVKGKLPNELNLYDMCGNVWEWCWDWYDDYPAEKVSDPSGAPRGKNKVYRGGSFFNDLNQLRVTFRSWAAPSQNINSAGFRIAQNG